jgi:hypothetical protein
MAYSIEYERQRNSAKRLKGGKPCKYLRENNLKRGKIRLGSQIQRFQCLVI